VRQRRDLLTFDDSRILRHVYAHVSALGAQARACEDAQLPSGLSDGLFERFSFHWRLQGCEALPVLRPKTQSIEDAADFWSALERALPDLLRRRPAPEATWWRLVMKEPHSWASLDRGLALLLEQKLLQPQWILTPVEELDQSPKKKKQKPRKRKKETPQPSPSAQTQEPRCEPFVCEPLMCDSPVAEAIESPGPALSESEDDRNSEADCTPAKASVSTPSLATADTTAGGATPARKLVPDGDSLEDSPKREVASGSTVPPAQLVSLVWSGFAQDDWETVQSKKTKRRQRQLGTPTSDQMSQLTPLATAPSIPMLDASPTHAKFDTVQEKLLDEGRYSGYVPEGSEGVPTPRSHAAEPEAEELPAALEIGSAMDSGTAGRKQLLVRRDAPDQPWAVVDTGGVFESPEEARSEDSLSSAYPEYPDTDDEFVFRWY
jgi:hypothetical protein